MGSTGNLRQATTPAEVLYLPTGTRFAVSPFSEPPIKGRILPVVLRINCLLNAKNIVPD